MQSIYKYTISFLLLLFVINGRAQDNKTDVDVTKVALLNGITVQADIAPMINSFISKGETYSSEGAVQLNLKYKYFPIIELGFGGANKTTADDIDFRANGLFGRVGIDFNLLKQKEKPQNNFFLAGVRLGLSNVSYDISNIKVNDEYWESNEVINFNNQSKTNVWYEIVAGVKVEIIKNIYMGWTVRKKNLLTKDVDGEVTPWYIPGFGINTSGTWGFSYLIGYKF